MAIPVRGSHGQPAFRRLAALAIVAVLAGCSSLMASTRLDVGPFAENTVGMIGVPLPPSRKPAGVTVPAAINVMAIVKNAASGASGLVLA
jgi:uncharacterized lipoprotein